MNRQKALLLVFLGLFACSLVYSFMRMPRQKSVDKLTYRPGMVATVTKKSGENVEDSSRLRLDLLEQRPVTKVSFKNNIFRALFPDVTNRIAIPLPLPPPPPPPPTVITAPALPLPTSPPVISEPTPLQREIARFTFLGFLKKDGKKTIFLASDKDIFLVKKGDKIAGKYDVTALTDDALTISSLQDGGEIIIPLIENKPLSAPKR